MEETQSIMQSHSLLFPKDTYLPGSLPNFQYYGCDTISPKDTRNYGRQAGYFRSKPSTPCPRTRSYDDVAHSSVAGNEEMDGTNDPNHYYQATTMGSARDLPSAYDTLGQMYPQPRDYFDRNIYAPSNTPMGTPGFAQTTSATQNPTKSFDVSYMAQPPILPVPDGSATWDSRWKSLFDSSKAQGLPSSSPTVSQYQQSCSSDSAALLAPECDTARRQSSDATSTSAKSVKSGYNPVSTVLAHHVYSVLKGEQAWNVIKQLQHEDIVRDVWSEIATLAHPDKAAPQARESRLWEQIVSGDIPLDLYRLGSEDLILLFAGLSVLARRAARGQSESPVQSTDQDPLSVFIDAHAEQ